MSNAEPFSYFRQRGINESNRSVYGWIGHNVNRPVDQAAETATDYASEKVEQGKKVASETADKVQSAAKQAAEKARQTAASASKAVGEATQNAMNQLEEAWNNLSWW